MDVDLAAGVLFQAIQAAKECALAWTAGANQCDDFPFTHFEIHIFEDMFITKVLVHLDGANNEFIVNAICRQAPTAGDRG